MNLKMGVAFFNAAPIFLSYRNTTLTPAKGMHKGTSEAPVLSESVREHRSKDLSMGRRQA